VEDAGAIERVIATGDSPEETSMRIETLATARSEILETAREILADDGAASVTLGRIARELGKDLPSLHEHFAGEAEVLACLAGDALLEQTRKLEDAGPDLLEQLSAYRRFAVECPAQYRLLTESPLARASRLDAPGRHPPQVFIDRLGDDLAWAAWAFAHGMVELELDGRLACNPDHEATWRLAAAAFAAAADRTGKQGAARRPAAGGFPEGL
jgi:AcrR family transcriptional regulator